MAEAGNYALGMFNIISMEYAEAVVRAAERVNLPVILGFPEAFYKYHDVEMRGPLLVRFAERAKVPCVVHIDHGVDYSLLMKAIKYGFTSIMFDGSALPHDENIQKTSEIVRWRTRSARRSRARSATWASRRARTRTRTQRRALSA